MIHLYLKTHNVTGIKYLGKTTAKDPHKYKGSGKYWVNHIRKHGYDVTTEILLKTDDPDKIKRAGLLASTKLNVVASLDFANLKEESGDGGWDHINSNMDFYNAKRKRTIDKLSDTELTIINRKKSNPGHLNGMYGRDRSGANNPRFGCIVSDETKKKISVSNTGHKASDKTKEKLSVAQHLRWSDPEARRQRSIAYKLKGHRPPSPKGLLWWNDGIRRLRSKTCPGINFKRGRKL